MGKTPGLVGLRAVVSLVLAAGLGGAEGAEEMVSIPGGTFLMGRDDGPADERPAHQLTVAPFALDRVPVTNAAFARFLKRRRRRAAPPPGGRVRPRPRLREPPGRGGELAWGAGLLRLGREAPADGGGVGVRGARDGRPGLPLGECAPRPDARPVRRPLERHRPRRAVPGGGQPLRRPGSRGQRLGVGEQRLPPVPLPGGRRSGGPRLGRGRARDPRGRPRLPAGRPPGHAARPPRLAAGCGGAPQHRVPLRPEPVAVDGTALSGRGRTHPPEGEHGDRPGEERQSGQGGAHGAGEELGEVPLGLDDAHHEVLLDDR
ncbi:MAG: SUMF1/EgtB/PvdO family nonheme iron enzyme, partial [candidate division NC10 bacterium]|nr:SUMF1/EgtB/PvdO family nonheme iron enzyme [candidate division NC10 bacterium]